MTGKNKAVVAGHICLDITPVFANGQKGARIDEILAPGKLVQMNEVDVHTGGAVANTGMAMKKFGADVTLMSKIGSDAFGTMILNVLEHQSMNHRMLISEENTSYSIILAPPGIDRIFLHNPGANDTFTYEDLDFNEIEKANLFHFGYPTLMSKLYENDGEELVRIFKRVKELGVVTSLDMAAIDPKSNAAKANWRSILSKVLPYVDFFVPSIEELCFMLDRPKFEEWMLRANGRDIISILSIKEDIKPLTDQLILMGAKVVLIKCGAPGIFYRTNDQSCLNSLRKNLLQSFTEWGNKEGFERSYMPKQVLSATGAGDTSIAAFLTSMLRGYTLEKCLQMATGTGASCVEAYDAFSGLRTLEELERKISSGWDKQNLI